MCWSAVFYGSAWKRRRLTVTVLVATTVTVEVEVWVMVDVGVGMLRQSQAPEMAEEATDVSQVGICGLASR